MLTFVRARQPSQGGESTSVAKSIWSNFGQSREVASILRRRRMTADADAQAAPPCRTKNTAKRLCSAVAMPSAPNDSQMSAAEPLTLLQPKLKVGTPGDIYEREADRVADQVLRSEPIAPLGRVSAHAQRACAACDAGSRSEEDESLQLKSEAYGPRRAVGSVAAIIAHSGRQMSPAERAYFEPRFGRDFSDVRVHDEPRAHAAASGINARAFTLGRHIAFGAGQYTPGTHEGRRLIAHELAHVVQQTGASSGSSPVANTVQRQDNGGAPSEPGGGTASETEVQARPAELTEIRPSAAERVHRIVISCADMKLQLETATTAHTYTLDECSLPQGSYETTVTITGNDFHLDFGKAASAGEEFSFAYRVEPDQENPAILLENQASVHVDVVDRLPSPRQERATTPECIVKLEDRELVPADSFNRNLFKPIKLKPTTIWDHRIPLGQFGWVHVAAKVSGGLTGTLAASYGPGRLSDICLTYLAEPQGGSASKKSGGQSDGTTYTVGGRARFKLPARATIRIAGKGRLKIAGDYLDVIEVAAAEGTLSALGVGTLSGEINGAVEVRARATKPRGRQQGPALPSQVAIDPASIKDVDLAAEIGLRGRAGLMFRVDLSAGFSVAGFDLWNESWNLAQFDAGVAWAGGLKYSPNPGLHWDLGMLGVADEMDLEEGEGLEDIAFHEDAAEVEEEDIIQAILDEDNARVATPDGLSERTALPFDWFKPIEIYPETVDIPNADDPKEIHRGAGPTTVQYQSQGRTIYEELGVADWPAVRRTFQYMPYTQRREPEKERFKRLLDRLGYDRAGTDAEHVWDLKLLGLEYDRFDNLWPASNQDQQLAGARHHNQIQNYKRTHGDIEGRWFIISRVRHPA